jgi:hypothetical protein
MGLRVIFRELTDVECERIRHALMRDEPQFPFPRRGVFRDGEIEKHEARERGAGGPLAVFADAFLDACDEVVCSGIRVRFAAFCAAFSSRN